MAKETTIMTDPTTDEELAVVAAAGDVQALDVLLRRHEGWVFNLAMYMLQSRPEAEDATQEILLKATTALASFRGDASFRTWVRHIAVNHVIDRRRSRAELAVKGFQCFGEYLAGAPDAEPHAAGSASPEQALLVEEAARGCTMGMLLCLDRQQRLVFVLGEILDAGDRAGAELLGTSRDNFRQLLARARRDLSSFLGAKCGLVDPRNPCRCVRKTRAFIKDGIVDPERLQFVDAHVERTRATAGEQSRRLTVLRDRAFGELRELYPQFAAPDVAARLRSVLEASDVFALNPAERAR